MVKTVVSSLRKLDTKDTIQLQVVTFMKLVLSSEIGNFSPIAKNEWHRELVDGSPKTYSDMLEFA